MQNEKIYVNIRPKPREIDRIHQQILYAPRLANHLSAITGLPAETQIYKIGDYADLDHSDGCPLLGVIVVNEPDSEPIIYLR